MQILIQSIWGAAQDFAFLTSSSEEVLMLPVTDHTLRSEGLNYRTHLGSTLKSPGS